MHKSFGSVGSTLAALVVVTVTLSGQLLAQCGWQSLSPLTGPNGTVRATTMWDPDGGGPASPVLVLAGEFDAAGSELASRIVTFDPATEGWSSLGAGVDGTVHALCVMPNGDLIAGGEFLNAGGVGATRVARWDGATWSALGSGSNVPVRAICALPNGDVVASGNFVTAGGSLTSAVGRWDGTSWSALGSGFTSGLGFSIRALHTLSNGDIIAGGQPPTFGFTRCIARWDGTSWSSLGAGLNHGINTPRVYAFTGLANGDVVASGYIDSAGSVPAASVARWDGTAWHAMGAGLESAYGLATMANGNVAATGAFGQTSSGAGGRVAIWNGVAWSAINGAQSVLSRYCLAELPGGDLVVGGELSVHDPNAAARWNGMTWTSVGHGFNYDAYSVATLPSGDIVVGGWFSDAPDVPARYAARWDGTAWHEMGPGLDSAPFCLAALPNGDVLAGVRRYIQPQYYAVTMRWDGTSWSQLGGLGIQFGMFAAPSVNALDVMPNGDVVAGGSFEILDGAAVNYVARWNGTAWVALGTGVSSVVQALQPLPNGHLLAGTEQGVMRWDGATWTPLGPPTNQTVNALAVLANGDIVAGGWFLFAGTTPANGIARWDGVTWSPLATGVTKQNALGVVFSLTTYPNGDLLIGGDFTQAGGLPATNIARWDGAVWSEVDGGADKPVNALAQTPSGDIAAVGAFQVVGNTASAYVALLANSCPAAVISLGGGCASSGGSNSLAATLPILGTTWTATGSGLPGSAFVAFVNGFGTASVPLQSVFPTGVPGCSLMVTPDLISLLAPVGGIAQGQLVLPNTGALAGETFYSQMVPFELDASLQVIAITATTALQVRIGY